MQASGIGRSFAVLLLLLAPPAALAADIAVLLPQTGRMSKAADAIRDGLMAAYYQDSTTAADSPVLHFYDSDADSPLGLIQKARTAGADFIIGPLDRERVEAVIKAGPPPVPVLALNNAPGHADNLLKFALSPEDEVARLVAWMHDQGIRRPLLLSAGDESSQRQLRLFQSAWHPGRTEATPAVVILDPARKGGIAMAVKGLATNISNRADALFLASPALARQVQPALTYYHIHVPLYSLSSAWDPTADPSGQNDLDGLHFCDLPWMLDTPRPEQQALYAAQPRPVAGYDRLYAFGADAWSVARSWSSLLNGEAR
ncbi:MAG TPA: penicillin-binding protein activator, partial [Moraxellaceae bacterium]|nr:penicillin-binding protein activator [Moraxellaceae bacterium]